MYPRIFWELVSDPLVCTELPLGTNCLGVWSMSEKKKEPLYSSSYKSFSVWIDFHFIISHLWHLPLLIPLQLLSFPVSSLLWHSNGTFLDFALCPYRAVYSLFYFLPSFWPPTIFWLWKTSLSLQMYSTPVFSLPKLQLWIRSQHFSSKHLQHSQLTHATVLRNSFNVISVLL